MKAVNIDGNIKTYSVLPKTWNNILNFQKASVEVQQQEGFYDVVKPEYDPFTQKLGEIYFDKESEVFTYPVEKRTDLPTIEEAKQIKIAELKSAVKDLYQTIQWYIEMKKAEGEAIPQSVIDKIRLIKTRYDNAKSAINALTSVVDVLKYSIPYDAINSMKEQLNSIV